MMNTVQDRLRIIRKNLGFSQDEIAIKTGAKRTTIAGYEAGVSLPHAEFLTALNKNYGINSNWLLTGEGSMFLSNSTESGDGIPPVSHQIPLLRQKVSCGPGQNWENEGNIDRYINVFDIIPRWKTGRIYAVPVTGSSMLGIGIRDGDIVLFDASKNQDTPDGNYIFSLDGEVYCKRLEFDSLTRSIKIYSVRVADLEKAELAMSFNADDTDIVDRMQIFGRVIGWVHPERWQE